MSWKYKTHLCKSRFRGDDFSSNFRCRRAADNESPFCVTCHGLLHMQTMTKQTKSYASLFPFSDLKLSISELKQTQRRWQRVRGRHLKNIIRPLSVLFSDKILRFYLVPPPPSPIVSEDNVWYHEFFFCSLQSPRSPPLASADALLLNPPNSVLQRASSNTSGTESLTTQKKYGSLDNLRFQGMECLPRLMSIRDPCQEARQIFSG